MLSRDRFVRFHAMQLLAAVFAATVMGLVGLLIGWAIVLAPMDMPWTSQNTQAVLAVAALFTAPPALAFLVLWAYQLIAAFKGEAPAYPIAGTLAKQWA